jgi:gamma-glutamyltranspeptidase/glutathione hydrolase
MRLLNKTALTLLLVAVQLNIYAIYPPPVSAPHSMVVSTHYLASQIGADILRRGGNAVDAAVAVGYTLAVVYPAAGNLGGGGFMTIRFADGKETFLNFREKAPLAARPDMYLDKQGNAIKDLSVKGYLAVAIPGTVMGLNTVLKKYGTLPLGQVMAPAIQLAEQGYVLNNVDTDILREATQDFAAQPNAAAIFLKKGKPYQAGDRLVQSQLADTLKQIAKGGSDAFYQGNIADRIVQASQKNGGILTKQDFTDYQVKELTPLHCEYHGYAITSAPPPSSGGVTLCEMLNILDGYPLSQWGYHSAKSIHYLTEAMRYAFYDRNQRLGDPDFVKNPVAQLLSKSYAEQIRRKINPDHAMSSDKLTGALAPEGNNTTHYSIIDATGNAVSVTYTLNNRFGARVMASDTGFFLNDEMDDFTVKLGVANLFHLVQSDANKIEPGKRPLSSMTPTIISKDGKVWMVVGSPGGPTIITSVLQTFLNVVDYGMDIQSAVDMPRIHMQWLPDQIMREPYAISPDAEEKLAALGYRFKDGKLFGVVQAILVDPKDHLLYGATDHRIPLGQAVGN